MRKTLNELTYKDNFMFTATMLDPENCRLVLERILDMPISRVEVSSEKSIIYHPEHRGVRLDVYAKSDDSHFDIEMQIRPGELFTRARFYHSSIDMELLSTGVGVEQLQETYVIFICDFDPIGLRKYKYTQKMCYLEAENTSYEDGTHTIFLNTKGTNDDEVSQELISFLKFAGADLITANEPSSDPLVRRLQDTIRDIKSDRFLEAQYMTLEELLKQDFEDGRAEGRALGLAEGKAEGLAEGKAEGLAEGKAEGLAEGKAEGLAESILLILSAKFGDIPPDMKEILSTVGHSEIYSKVLLLATQVKSLSDFKTELETLIK